VGHLGSGGSLPSSEGRFLIPGGGLDAIREALSALGERLGYRLRIGGDRIPVEIAQRLEEILETVADHGNAEGPHETLEQIRAELQGCARCDLHRFRKNVVLGEGDPHARLVFVGEGPGEEEDLQGRPFVGPAGQLLTRIIQAMGFQRDEVYIANVVKCRPPANRTPKPEEVAICSPFLFRQLRAISPAVICALGSVAAQTLLDTRERISRLRGHMHRWEGTPIMPTFHPSHLLRHSEHKRAVWEDMKQVIVYLK
jgi:uracil-DNA glycosylase family 4